MSEVISEGGDPVEEQVAPEGEATEAVETPAAPEAEVPALDPLELQAELEHMREQYGQVLSVLEQYSQQAAPGQFAQQVQQQTGIDVSQLTDEYGNFNAQAFAQYQAQQNQALLSQIGEMFQPLQQTFAQQQESAVIAEGEQRLADILADDIARNGEFASDPEADAKAREMVSTLASQIFPEVADRYGTNPRAAEIAMTRAATEVRALLRSVGGAAVSQTQNQLATLAGARGEPGAHGAGVEAPVIRLNDSVASKYATGGSGA